VKASGKKSGFILRLLIFTILLLISLEHGYAQTPSPPTLICASTEISGAVTLRWDIANPGSVDHYNIYWSNAPTGPFNMISFLNDGVSVTWQITGINGNNFQYYFYMRSYNAAGDSSAASPLVSNIFLQMNVSIGKADLSWNAFDPLMPGTYNLVRTDTSGIPITIYSGTGLSFRDIITSPYCVIPFSLSYRVEFTGGCISYSNIKTDQFSDKTNPPDVLMDSISIGPNGRPVISWEASTSTDVAGYEIQQQIAGGIWQVIGFASGSSTTFFSADSLKACSGIKTFVIITTDLCGNKSTGVNNYDNPLNTLFLNPVLQDECLGTATLSWNPYNYMTPSLKEYLIYRSEDFGPFTLIGSTADGITTFTDTQGLLPGSGYHYYVRAVSTDGKKSSRSCDGSITYNGQANPNALSLNYVSVINSQYVEMSIHFGPVETVTTLRVYRAGSQGGAYTLIDSISPGILGDIPFSDPTASVNTQSYFYKIVALNSCKMEAIWSDSSRTIFLTCNANADQSNTLTWNEYTGWANIQRYEVNRLVNGVPDPANPIGTTAPGTTIFTDLPAAPQQAGNVISYYIRAIEGNIMLPNIADTSVSNIARAIRQPVVSFPNAFVPRGLNNIFRPVMDFVDDGNYKLLIYNKWGQQVFVSDNKDIGWDGKFKGDYAPTGIYFYHLQYSSFTGENFTKTGSLMLVE
jgi:gliding motility-associated-like protein